MNGVAIAVSSDTWGFLCGVLRLGIIVIGLTFFLTLGIGSIPERKKQVITAFFLLFAVLLWFTIPMLFLGEIPDTGYIFEIVAVNLLIALAIITPGILWFWPKERRNIVKDTLMCSVFSLALGVLLYAGISLIVPARTLVVSLSGLLTVLANIPGGLHLTLLIIFTVIASLAYIGYWVIGTIRSRVSASG